MLNHLKRSISAAAAVLAVSLGASAAPASAGYSHLLPAPLDMRLRCLGRHVQVVLRVDSAATCLVNAAHAKRGLSPYAMYGNLLGSA